MRRRTFLQGVAGTATGLALAACTADRVTTAPGRRLVVARGATTLSGTVEAAAVDVAAGAVLELDPDVSTTLTVTGNVVVEGLLRMQPRRPDVVHTLRFRDVDESRFVGGGGYPVATDVGLWVVGAGALDLAGTPRAGWNRTGRDPSWRAGDLLLRAPQDRGDFATYRTHTPGVPVPVVEGPDGSRHPTEVFDLTRNVVVEGAPGARAHVFVSSTSPQRVRHVLFRWLGPRRRVAQDAFHHAGVTPGRLGASTEAEYPPGYFSAASAAASEPVLGRYPLHFHHCGEGSRGTLVEGCVVRDSSRAFVPHGSHGITLRDCVAFRIRDDAYWWDERHPTDDLLWEHCAAFDVRHDPVGSGSPAGFLLGLGRGTTIRDCVAVGVHGGTGAAGFAWPAFASDRPDNQWVARDLVAHNCAGDGLYVWQDDNKPHRVDDVVGYRNGGSGLVHGAHRNGYRYAGVVLFDNAYADLYHLALNRDDAAGEGQRWTGVWAPHLLLGAHGQDARRPVRFLDAHVERLTVDETGQGAGAYELHADLAPSAVTVLQQRSRIELVGPDGSAGTV